MKKIAYNTAIKFYSPINRFVKLFYRKGISQGTYTKIIKYYFVAGITLVLNYVLFNVLFGFGLGVGLSNAITYVFVFTTGFALQKLFTFKARGNTLRQLIFFAIHNLAYFAADTTLLLLFIDKWHINPLIGKILSIAILIAPNFVIQKKIVFAVK